MIKNIPEFAMIKSRDKDEADMELLRAVFFDIVEGAHLLPQKFQDVAVVLEAGLKAGLSAASSASASGGPGPATQPLAREDAAADPPSAAGSAGAPSLATARARRITASASPGALAKVPRSENSANATLTRELNPASARASLAAFSTSLQRSASGEKDAQSSRMSAGVAMPAAGPRVSALSRGHCTCCAARRCTRNDRGSA